MPMRIILSGSTNPFNPMNFDNDTDATAFINSLTIAGTPYRELISTEVDAIADPEWVGNNSYTTVTGTTLSNAVVTCSYSQSNSELEAMVKDERNRRLKPAFDAKQRYDREQENASLTPPVTVADGLTSTQHRQTMAYIQSLCDIVEQTGFPWNGPDDPAVPWPTKPSHVKEESIF